jgi:putative transcriptional regulator
VFAGYAGWAAGQLDDEIAAGAWLTVEALPQDAFASHPERLYPEVLRRQGGDLALLSTFPDDPALN